MLTFIVKDGRIDLDRPDLEMLLLQVREGERAQAEAEQRALMRVYVFGQISPEEAAGGIGLLRIRMARSEKTLRGMIKSGQLHYVRTAQKGYVVSEYHVRMCLGIPVPPLAPTLGDALARAAALVAGLNVAPPTAQGSMVLSNQPDIMAYYRQQQALHGL